MIATTVVKPRSLNEGSAWEIHGPGPHEQPIRHRRRNREPWRCWGITGVQRLENGSVEPYSLSLAIAESLGSIVELRFTFRLPWAKALFTRGAIEASNQLEDSFVKSAALPNLGRHISALRLVSGVFDRTPPRPALFQGEQLLPKVALLTLVGA
jgi:hypothetical protein